MELVLRNAEYLKFKVSYSFVILVVSEIFSSNIYRNNWLYLEIRILFCYAIMVDISIELLYGLQGSNFRKHEENYLI